MDTRRLVLALLLAPVLFFGFVALREQVGRERALPHFSPDEVARIELSHAGEELVLSRKAAAGPDGAQWSIPTAADAPGDAARIRAALVRLAKLEGKPVDSDAPAPAAKREPVILRLLDAKGKPLAEAAFWSREVRPIPDGPLLAIEKPPALPLWPSAWSSQKPPRIDPSTVVKAERLTPEGPVALPDSDAAEIAAMLGGLSAGDFVAASGVDWMGARMVRVTLLDGSAIDLAQVPDGEGRFHLRLASDTRADVRASRRLAFRVSKALP